MAFLVMILGLVSVAGGLAMIGFGIPINEFGLGNTLISAGVTALVGGFLLFGLAAAVRQLEHIAKGLPTRRLARTARTTDVVAPPIPVRNGPRLPIPPRSQAPDSGSDHREPRVGPASPVSFSSEAIERMRSSIPRLDRGHTSPHEDEAPLSPQSPSPGLPFPMPKPVGVDRADSSADGEVRTEARPSFPWRSKNRGEAESRGNRQQSQAHSERPVPSREQADRGDSAAPNAVAEPTAAAQQPVAILKSGVVDGMAYTLYADGSIEAKLPEGTVRFASISELRAHLEQSA